MPQILEYQAKGLGGSCCEQPPLTSQFFNLVNHTASVMNNLNEAAGRLRHLCVVLDLTPEDFAARLNLPLRSARRVLRYSRKPSLGLMARVQQAMPELSAKWLLCGEGSMFHKPQQTGDTVNSHVGINQGNSTGAVYGTCHQTIYSYSSSWEVNQVLQAQLADKERTIQLLLTQFPLFQQMQ